MGIVGATSLYTDVATCQWHVDQRTEWSMALLLCEPKVLKSKMPYYFALSCSLANFSTAFFPPIHQSLSSTLPHSLIFPSLPRTFSHFPVQFSFSLPYTHEKRKIKSNSSNQTARRIFEILKTSFCFCHILSSLPKTQPSSPPLLIVFFEVESFAEFIFHFPLRASSNPSSKFHRIELRGDVNTGVELRGFFVFLVEATCGGVSVRTIWCIGSDGGQGFVSETRSLMLPSEKMSADQSKPGPVERDIELVIVCQFKKFITSFIFIFIFVKNFFRSFRVEAFVYEWLRTFLVYRNRKCW